MEYRQLGRCGLRVSTMTLGTMTFGGTGWASVVGQTDVEGARRQIDMAREAGVNMFDTADVYSSGLSEEILGKALGSDRDDVLIATKVRLPTGDGPNDAGLGLSRHHIMRAVYASLRRLGTDYIDLYQVHEVGRPAPFARDPASPRRPGPAGQGPLRRRLELRRLAPHEGAVDRRPARPDAVRQHAGPLLLADPRHRERDRSRHGGPRDRHPRVEPDGRRCAPGAGPRSVSRSDLGSDSVAARHNPVSKGASHGICGARRVKRYASETHLRS